MVNDQYTLLLFSLANQVMLYVLPWSRVEHSTKMPSLHERSNNTSKRYQLAGCVRFVFADLALDLG